MRDPNDIPLALAAITAQVDFFVTQDKDFTDRTPENENLHRRLVVILPGTFLRIHMGWTSEQLEAIRIIQVAGAEWAAEGAVRR
ncbi:MAG: hypothetical protein ACYDBJ_01275 [Aggregatilineales bacterium]